MTKEILEELNKFEEYFRIAIERGYSRMLLLEHRKRLVEIYNLLIEKKKWDINCSSCVTDLLKQIGKLYFLEKEKSEVIPEQNIIEESQEVKKPKRKRIKK